MIWKNKTIIIFLNLYRYDISCIILNNNLLIHKFDLMKYNIILLIVVVLSIGACTKSSHTNIAQSGTDTTTGCIQRIYIPLNSYSIKSADTVIVNTLFSNNGLPLYLYQYYKYDTSSFQTYYPPYAVKFDQNVRVNQYTNGLMIFNGDMVFNFINGILDFTGGTVTNGTNLDTISYINLQDLRRLWVNDLKNDTTPLPSDITCLKDSCLKAQFGYFNLNSGVYNAPEVLVKAWKVTPLYSVYPSEYPVGFYKDDGTKISFNDGIEH